MSSLFLETTDTRHQKEARKGLPRPPKEVVISKKEIGERVRAVRQARDLTQAQLGDIIGTRHTNVSGIERGVRGLTLHQVVKLARALDISAAEILEGDFGKKAKHARNGRLPRRFERMQALPRAKQRVLFEIIDAFLEKHGSSHRA
jgi:transcriptional regulator with XRE-family HTH domain